MEHHSSEVVVLRPTAVFWAFLASQLPQSQRPTLNLIQVDCTALTIDKRNTDEETLHLIEKNYKTFFRHEITRWLGPEASHEIVESKNDFACCFQLEFHTHLMLLEPDLNQVNQLVIIKPQAPLFDWWQKSFTGVQDAEKVTLSHLEENASVLLKNFNSIHDIKPFLATYYQPIINAVVGRLTNRPNYAPFIDSFTRMCHYFKFELHTKLIHL